MICRKCKQDKLEADFVVTRKKGIAYPDQCKECKNAYRREWRKTTEKGKAERLANAKANKVRHKEGRSTYFKLKEKFFDMYGRRCACCGETISEFLTLEHINGQKGQKYKSGEDAWRIAVKEYRPDLYEVLCMNCNYVKRFGKICPHKNS